MPVEEQQQTQTVEFDPETATYEELAAAAQKEAEEEAKRQSEQQGQQTEQVRDEKGQFARREQSSPQQEQQEVDEIVYRREIDLGDGSGVQVFEGATYDELIDKFAKAQENATRKIRELTAARKAEEEKKPARTPEQEWLLSQELLANPTSTVSKMFEEVVGMPVTAFKTKMQRLDAFERAQSEEQAAQEFIAKHPEYVPNARNAQRIERYVRTYQLDGTKAESIEKAYADLMESGLLETKSAEKQTQQTQETTQQTRIVSEQQSQGRQRMSSGISSKRSATNRAPEPTEEDLYNMPLDKLRGLAISESQN